MRPEAVRPGSAERSSGGPLKDRKLDPGSWQKAWRAFLDENYAGSLQLARACLDAVDGDPEPRLALVTGAGSPTVADCVVLCARNLFQLDRYQDFEVLLASAGRWGMVADESPELDLVELSFACKRGDYVQVVDEASAFIEQHRHSLPPAIADFLYLRALAFSHLGDSGRAREDAEASHSLFRVLGRDFDGARAANLLGMVAFRASEYAAAVGWFRRALEMHTQLGMIKNMGGNRLNIGIAFYKQGLFSRALTELKAANRLLVEVGARVSLCRAAIAEGNILRLQRDFGAARKKLLVAYESANGLMLSREEALALEFLGDLCRDEGAFDKARRYYSRALAIGRSIAPDGDIVMEVLRRQGECLEKMGRQSDAVAVLGHALTMTRRQGDRFEEGVVRRVLAETLLGLGDLDSAAHHAGESVELLKEVGANHERALAHLASARIRLARLDGGAVVDPGALLDQAWSQAMSALDLFLRIQVDHWTVAARELLGAITKRRAEHQQAESMVVAPERPRSRQTVGFPAPIIHVSARMRDLIQLADAFAASEEPVLITGETGTGKELFAQRLHAKSRRHGGELVCVNVSAIPDTMFAREFFGHVKGSFSGADQDGIGLAAQADGGTLFLDEIGDLPPELQPQLLRLLQDGTYQAIGDPAQRRSNIRLVAATNADLQARVARGSFRADLYYRLKVLELPIPAVAERTQDILPLLRYFLNQAAGRQVEIGDYFTAESIARMEQYGWPGNVREIAMVARRALVQSESSGAVDVVVSDASGREFRFCGPGTGRPNCGRPEPVGNTPSGLGIRSRILLALAEADGNRAEAARRLGISRSTLYRQMEKLGIAGKVASDQLAG